MALTKTTLIQKISEKNNQSPSQAKDTLESLIEIIKSTLASGEDIMISGFGKFQVNEKAPRKGRNPATGKEMMLDGRRVVTFKSTPIHHQKKQKTSLRLMDQADRMFVQPKTYHQRGETYYVTRRITIQV